MSSTPDKSNNVETNISGTTTLRNSSDAIVENGEPSKEIQSELTEKSVSFHDHINNTPSNRTFFKQDDESSDHGSMEIGPPTPPTRDNEIRPPTPPLQEDEVAKSGPPPIPPRPEESGGRAEYEEWAQQHDVQEVIENVLYQLRWSMSAERTETNGEQVDAISR